MGQPQVGLPSPQGDIAKYATTFDMVEVRPDALGSPKPATVRGWRKAVNPSFTFSVVLPRSASTLEKSPAIEKEVKHALELAKHLEARCVLVETNSEIRPTKANRTKLEALFKRLQQPSVVVCWEPHGVWEGPEIHSMARAMGVVAVQDGTTDTLSPGHIAYTRIRSLGRNGVSDRAISKLAEQLVGRRDAWVVVEDRRSAKKVIRGIQETLGNLSPQSSPIIVRPSPGRLRADDEEQ